MDEKSFDRLFNFWNAFEHPVTIAICAGVTVALVVAFLLIRKMKNRVSEESYQELNLRWRSWCWLIPMIVLPILLGAAWTMAAVLLLCIFCYREYARMTGLFRAPLVSLCVVIGILLCTFAALDHFDRLYFAVLPITLGLITAATIQQDRPEGYIQRVALGVLGFCLFGFSLTYLSLISNTGDIGNGIDYRPLLLLLFLSVELNDIYAFCCGKLTGGPKLFPNTSPGKTVSGSVGGIILTSITVMLLGYFIFQGTPLADWSKLMTLGIFIAGLGQLGDLILSSIKRDLNVKDTGNVIAGHGGLLDRFDSLVLVPPAFYHFVSYFLEDLGPLGIDQPVRIITGG